MTRRGLLSLICALALQAACGGVAPLGPVGGEEGPSAARPTEPSLLMLTEHAEFCRSFAAARCAREIECGRANLSQLGACKRIARLSCEEFRPQLLASSVKFQSEQARACVGAISVHRCFFGAGALPEGCAFERLYVPNAQNGESCRGPGECATGFCGGAPGACRTCQRFRAVGETCDCSGGSALCSGALRCNPSTSFCPVAGGSSGTRTCQALLADGKACAEHEQCSARYCSLRDPAGRLQRSCGRVPAGGSCGSYDDCAPGTYCSGLVLTGAPTAGACAARIPLGGSCDQTLTDPGCAGANARCVGDRCTDVPPFSRGLGAACSGPAQCQEHLFCDLRQPAPTCVERKAPGDACDESSTEQTCRQGSFCAPDGRCQTLRAEGQACEISADCGAFLDCSTAPDGSSRCTRWLFENESCAPMSNTCLFSFCSASSGMCTAPQPEGAACTGHDQCRSKRCGRLPDGAQQCLAACSL